MSHHYNLLQCTSVDSDHTDVYGLASCTIAPYDQEDFTQL